VTVPRAIVGMAKNAIIELFHWRWPRGSAAASLHFIFGPRVVVASCFQLAHMHVPAKMQNAKCYNIEQTMPLSSTSLSSRQRLI